MKKLSCIIRSNPLDEAVTLLQERRGLGREVVEDTVDCGLRSLV